VNRTDRLFAITVLLQSRARLRALDLARRFGVSKRTIYRDIVALSESGVPIISLPGEGYELTEGFSLPPLALSTGEASALFLGGRLLTEHATGRLGMEAAQALEKIAAILPAPTRAWVERLTSIVDFIASRPRFDLDDPRLALLQDAIAERRVVHLRYHSRSRDEATERDVEPERLHYNDGVWYLAGYCRLRQGNRDFRLERIEELAVLDERFVPRVAETETNLGIEMRVRFAASVLRWVRERQHYGFVREQPGADAGMVMIYRVDATDEMLPWLRAWGPAAEVLAPVELREALREEAKRMVEMLT
jgi:predicted DNA-binding transcriptional regulator YafY